MVKSDFSGLELLLAVANFEYTNVSIQTVWSCWKNNFALLFLAFGVYDFLILFGLFLFSNKRARLFAWVDGCFFCHRVSSRGNEWTEAWKIDAQSLKQETCLLFVNQVFVVWLWLLHGLLLPFFLIPFLNEKILVLPWFIHQHRFIPFSAMGARLSLELVYDLIQCTESVS